MYYFFRATQCKLTQTAHNRRYILLKVTMLFAAYHFRHTAENLLCFIALNANSQNKMKFNSTRIPLSSKKAIK